MDQVLSSPVVSDGRLEAHFKPYREQILGIDQRFNGPFGRKKILYADWIASGRLYRPIEKLMMEQVGPYVANTHTETSYTGKLMTRAYHRAREIIKKHVNARSEDVLIPTGTGMTGAVLKLQRIMGFKIPEQFSSRIELKAEERPVVFISHMEHHSNQTSWLETNAEVVQIQPNSDGLPDLDHFQQLLEQYADRPMKIASITSCSNVTGVFTPYSDIARMIHKAGGFCFVDFACSGPYVDIDMHPEDEEARLDAIFFSPHKFLGGPGTPGILVFSSELYHNKIPDQPGGGTVEWTNPWGGHHYIDDIEVREDGGTPGFLQTIRAAKAMQLKEQMGTANIHHREKELVDYVFKRLSVVPGLHILAGNIRERLGAFSFFLEDLHFNLVVAVLNDKYGIQTRGGCSCAGTYGHYLLHLDPQRSTQIYEQVHAGNLSAKPGWVRLSLHPTMLDKEVKYICNAIEEIAEHAADYQEQYLPVAGSNEFKHKNPVSEDDTVKSWFRDL